MRYIIIPLVIIIYCIWSYHSIIELRKNKRYPDGFIFNLHDADVGDTWFLKVIEMEEDEFNGMEELDYE